MKTIIALLLFASTVYAGPTVVDVDQDTINSVPGCRGAIGCYAPDTRTIYILFGISNREDVLKHETAHDIINTRYPESILLPVDQQEEMARRLAKTL